jgi:UMF1 family MFS transporter
MDARRREQTGWYFYDFANSAFSTTVVTLFLGPYLTDLAQAGARPNGYIYPLGIPVDPRSYWAYLVAVSVASQVVLLPMVGALADHTRHRKQLLALFAYIGAAATIAMFSLTGAAWLIGGVLFLAANLSLGASMVVYNSFLPDIAAEAERDSVSSKGWGIGYLGGGALLALNLALFYNAGRLGLTPAQAVRASLASAGLWWAVFTLIPLAALHNRPPARRALPGEHILRTGFIQLAHTLRDLRRYPQTVLFLIAYLLYSDAIQTVITLATEFGNQALKIPLAALALLILMVQFVAFFGAIAFNRLAAGVGTKRAVMLALVVWIGVLVAIYLSVRTTTQFFIMGAVVGLVMGGSQALSRSLYSLMIPKSRKAEYFGLYEISDKGTSWIGPLLFGLTLQFTGNYRLAILSMVVFFMAGLLLLARVDVRRATRQAGNE